jgi:lipopolysaccharide transport system ATP-binding protein
MSSDTAVREDFAIRLRDVSKHYLIYGKPEDRLKQMVLPRLAKAVGRKPKAYFRHFAAVDNVSLDIGHGETIGIVGRNGSGKSTLLQMICGTLQPSSGTVEVKGRIAALLELGAGFNPEFTGKENVYLNGAILGLSRSEIDERYDRIAAFADIGHFINQPVKTYSSGMYVRLAFAVAINVDPAILIVDEALAVGDEAFQRKCFARIEAIKEQGATILFVSHGAQTVIQLCDRAVLLDAGEKLLEGEPKRVVGQYQRLISADDEAASRIRNEILSGAAADAGVGRETGMEQPGEETSADPSVFLPNLVDAPPDELDTGLISESTMRYSPNGATISRVRIENSFGETVNIINKRRIYSIKYNIHFVQDCTDVSFGCMIRTVSGLDIAGAATTLDPQTRIPFVEKGKSIDVEIDFECVLSSGTYFINVGVIANEGQYVDRILDVSMFRVRPESRIISTGDIDFVQEIRSYDPAGNLILRASR